MILPLLLFQTPAIDMFFSFSTFPLYILVVKSDGHWHIDDLGNGVCFELLASHPEQYVQIWIFPHLPLDSLQSCLNISTIFHPNEYACKPSKMTPFLMFHMTVLIQLNYLMFFLLKSHRMTVLSISIYYLSITLLCSGICQYTATEHCLMLYLIGTLFIPWILILCLLL